MKGDVWDNLRNELESIVGGENCGAFIQYLRTLDLNAVHNELANLLDNENPKHTQILNDILSSGVDLSISKTLMNTPELKNENTNVNYQSIPVIANIDNYSNSSIQRIFDNKFTSQFKKNKKPRINKVKNNRKGCTCLAQRHKLINNCTSCGRIVCEIEGSGPCLTCGELVYSNEEQEILLRNTNKSVALLKKLTDPNSSLGTELQTAVNRKDKLISQDKTFEKTKNYIIDDQNDYYTSRNRWLPEEAREYLKGVEEENDEQADLIPINKFSFDYNYTGSLMLVDVSSDSDEIDQKNKEMEDIVESIINRNFVSHEQDLGKDSFRKINFDPRLVDSQLLEFQNAFNLNRRDSLFSISDFGRVQYSDENDYLF